MHRKIKSLDKISRYEMFTLNQISGTSHGSCPLSFMTHRVCKYYDTNII